LAGIGQKRKLIRWLLSSELSFTKKTCDLANFKRGGWFPAWRMHRVIILL